MAIRTELNVRLANSPGALEQLCRLLDEENVDIEAMTLESNGQLRLVVDNHVRGAAVLRERHHQVAERDVLMLSVSNDALASALGLLSAADVNVEYVYGSLLEDGPSSIVVGVADPARAAAAAGV
jgi:hypothetical protein